MPRTKTGRGQVTGGGGTELVSSSDISVFSALPARRRSIFAGRKVLRRGSWWPRGRSWPAQRVAGPARVLPPTSGGRCAWSPSHSALPGGGGRAGERGLVLGRWGAGPRDLQFSTMGARFTSRGASGRSLWELPAPWAPPCCSQRPWLQVAVISRDGREGAAFSKPLKRASSQSPPCDSREKCPESPQNLFS